MTNSMMPSDITWTCAFMANLMAWAWCEASYQRDRRHRLRAGGWDTDESMRDFVVLALELGLLRLESYR